MFVRFPKGEKKQSEKNRAKKGHKKKKNSAYGNLTDVTLLSLLNSTIGSVLLEPSTWRPGPLIEVVGVETRVE